MQKLIIEVAINENLTSADHPNVPITPDEIAQEASATSSSTRPRPTRLTSTP